MNIDREKLLDYYAMEKEAFGKGKLLQGILGFAGRQIGNLARSPVGKSVATKATNALKSPVGRGVKGLADDAVKAVSGKAKSVADAAAPYAKPVADRVGQLGQTVTTGSRRALNKLDDVAQYAMSGPGRAKAPFVTRWGDSLIGKTDVNPLSVRNLGIGAGTVAAGTKGVGALAAGMAGGGGAGATAGGAAANPMAQQAMTQTSTGGGGFLSSMPREMQYALAAGVPLALLGAYMGGRGNTMSGLGLGALGLGAAGLGAAGAGYFGDDARRMVGQGANSLMSLFGDGGQNDIMGQIKQLSRLSPEFGVTMLMGRNPGLSREEAQRMYEFLTQNQDAISKMLPAVTGAPQAVKAGAAIKLALELDKAARCWKGYEPVPGKKPYSNDSCRPVGSKKKKEKKAAFPFDPSAYGAPQAMTFDPNNANVKMLQQRHPQNWRKIMAQSQGMQNASPKNVRSTYVPALTGGFFNRPTMTQMPPKPPMQAGPPRDFSNLPPYFSEGQHQALQAAQKRIGQPMPQVAGMLKTQSAHDFGSLVADHDGIEKEALIGAAGRFLGRGLATAAMRGIPALSRGMVQGAGHLAGAAGKTLAAGGKAMAQAGNAAGQMGAKMMSPTASTVAGHAGNALGGAAATLGGAGQLAGRMAQGFGNAAAMGGKALQTAGQYTATALPLSAAGAYGAYQAARPMLPNVQFRNPIADMGGVDVRLPRFQAPVTMN